MGLHCGELKVNRPATSTAVPSQKLGPKGGAGGRYGKLKVKAKMVVGTMLDMTSVWTTLPAGSHHLYAFEPFIDKVPIAFASLP